MTISEQLRELLAEATPGDWWTELDKVFVGHPPEYEMIADLDPMNRGGYDGADPMLANAALIVFLRNHAPHFATLEEENVRLRAEISTLRQLLHDIRLEAGETIPPDGKAAAFAALHQICRMISTRAALQEQPKCL